MLYYRSRSHLEPLPMMTGYELPRVCFALQETNTQAVDFSSSTSWPTLYQYLIKIHLDYILALFV
jgi:hypothetical protein